MIIKNGGKDLIESLTMIFIEIDNQKKVPDQWTEMIIISVYKNKGERKDLENRRGLFITNSISKLYDRVKMDKNNRRLNRHISKFQVGGMIGKGTVDHTMTLDAVINYNKLLGCETYILFADAYKCFDKLNLKDCICDISEIIGVEEAYELYIINQKGKATIKTPVGMVENIKADNIVRQGTIPGPKLCCVNTDGINKTGRKCYTYIGPRVRIETLAFVDDLKNASTSIENTVKAARNLSSFEKMKGYTFSIDKKKTAILISGKKKNKTYNIQAEVKNGQIVMTKEYKYVGSWYNEKGDNALRITKKQEKIGYYIQKTKQHGNEFKIGRFAISARIKIYKSIIVKTMYYNVEAWSNITKTEMEELEKMQRRVVCGMCELPKTTPYIGLLAELGIWPVEQQLHYRQIMLLHNILQSDDNRLLKELVEDQIYETWNGSWYEGIKTTCDKYGIELNDIRTWSKFQCKNITKRRIEDHIQELFQESKQEMRKLRFIQEFGKKKYLDDLEYQDSITMLKVRLNMIETKCNYKGNFKENEMCQICQAERDTTEHLLVCQNFQTEIQYMSSEDMNIENSNEKLAKFIEYMIKS